MSTSSCSDSPFLAVSESVYAAESTHPDQLIEVLVDCPSGAQGLFTYRLPVGLEVQSGDILCVPFGSQQVGAIAVRKVTCLPPELDLAQLRAVEDVLSQGFFPTAYWTLLDRVAQYYHTPLIQVIRAALPPGLLRRSQRRIRLITKDLPAGATDFLSLPARQLLELLHSSQTGDYAWKYLQQHIKGAQRGLRELLRQGWVESYLKPIGSAQPKLQSAVTLLSAPVTDLTPRQREVLEVLKHRGGDLWLQDLLQACRTSSSILKALEKKGCIAIESRQVLRLEQGLNQPIDQPRRLTSDQASALTIITTLSGFAQVLLHGVTGSGKTEVYLQAIAPILQQGQSALVLVPEIGLTPQLTDRFRARFGAKVCVYHSALSDGERYDTWRQLLNGIPQVIIGTRSAVFAPLPRLGLIVLDEEHDAGFKQDQSSPCYHARTVACWRAELENCPLVLGSATPSLETWVRVREPGGWGDEEMGGWTDGEMRRLSLLPRVPVSHYLSLPERVQARPMPIIEVVDMRQELKQNRSMFSRALQAAIQNLEAQDGQGLLFVHRRGHSTFVSCRSCGHVMNCPNCDVSLTYHHTQEARPLLRCHYCNHTGLHPPHCPECGSAYFKYFGSGTQRVMRELTQQFPNLRLIRFDSDTTRTKGAHRTLLERFAQGEANLMVGTQMLTKGIDLPQVKLVGVLAADGLFNLPDYRASERAFQVLTQVAGRAGRGDHPGRVIVQTYTPEHPVIQAVRNYDCEGFIEAELQQRATLTYPPYGQLILLRLSGLNVDAVKEAAQTLAQFLQQQLQSAPFQWELLGPAPANVLRVARRYRWQILLKLSRNSGAVNINLPIAELRSRCPSSVRLTIDVDPLSLLS